MLEALAERPELAAVAKFIGDVEDSNAASAALVTGAGFQRVTDRPDEDGFSYFAMRADGERPRRVWNLPRADIGLAPGDWVVRMVLLPADPSNAIRLRLPLRRDRLPVHRP
jgi:hypothetical protein